MKLNRGKNIRLFKNSFMEWTTHVHPITPLVLWGPVALFLYYRSYFVHQMSLGLIFAFAVLALFIWTLTEYVLHRFIFHFKPIGPWTEWLVYIFHEIHHIDPDDETRLVMPPISSITLSVPVMGTFYLLFGSPWFEPFGASFLVGYLIYDYTHYAVHFMTPKTAWGKMIKHNHLTHHYLAPDSRWGVSSPIWDILFGTFNVKAKNKETVSNH